MLRASDKPVVLIVNHDKDQQFTIREIVREDHPGAVIRSVYDGKDLIDYYLRSGNYSNSIDEIPNIILLHNKLPDLSGIEALYEIRENPSLKDAHVYVLGDTKTFFDSRTNLDSKIKGYYVLPADATHRVSFIIKQILNREFDYLKKNG